MEKEEGQASGIGEPATEILRWSGVAAFMSTFFGYRNDEPLSGEAAQALVAVESMPRVDVEHLDACCTHVAEQRSAPRLPLVILERKLQESKASTLAARQADADCRQVREDIDLLREAQAFFDAHPDERAVVDQRLAEVAPVQQGGLFDLAIKAMRESLELQLYQELRGTLQTGKVLGRVSP